VAYAVAKKVTGTYPIPNNTVTQIMSLDASGNTSGPGVWDNGASCFVTPAGVSDEWHEVGALVEWDGEQVGAHLVEARVNGTVRYVLSQIDGDWSVVATTGLVQGGQCYVRLSAGDEVSLWVRQISGASQTLAKVTQFSVRAVTL
jgi:hypothetical protein